MAHVRRRPPLEQAPLMQNIELVSRAIDFIEGHLGEAITVADMAEAAACSLYHFCRIFNQTARHTPYDYLMRRRLSGAALALLKTDRKIIDIACDYQFNSPETFSRAFKRMFDLQPNQIRKQGRLGLRALMPPLTRAHLQQMAKNQSLTPALEEKEAFQVAGVMTLVKPGRMGVAELWEWLAQEEANRPAQGESGEVYGIAYYPDDWETCGFWYLAGMETKASGSLPPPLVTQTIPALNYACFIHTGTLPELPLTLDYIYHTWLPQSGQRLAASWVIENYRPAFKYGSGEETEISVYLPIQ
jgi:AraC family transcriptional regulator